LYLVAHVNFLLNEYDDDDDDDVNCRYRRRVTVLCQRQLLFSSPPSGCDVPSLLYPVLDGHSEELFLLAGLA